MAIPFTFDLMKTESDRMQDARSRWATGVLLAFSLLIAAIAFINQATVAAVVFGVAAVFFAGVLCFLPASWNRFITDVLSNFGW